MASAVLAPTTTQSRSLTGESQQLVPHRAADQVGFHAGARCFAVAPRLAAKPLDSGRAHCCPARSAGHHGRNGCGLDAQRGEGIVGADTVVLQGVVVIHA